MIDWKKIKETYTLEDFCNILERNKPRTNNNLYKDWEYLINIAYTELAIENERPNECEKIIDEIISFLRKQKKINLKGFVYPVKEMYYE